MKQIMALAAMAATTAALALEPAATIKVTVYTGDEMGPVKLMNSVNGGPIVANVNDDQKFGNFEAYRALKIPFARIHDCINGVSGGAHSCDVSAIFPNFDADENDPKNYDFVFTDHYLDCMRRAGTQVFFRLGQTIEHGPKKYGALPPKDYAKWARICEHIIRHYNEGWGWGADKALTTRNIAWSNQYNIVYWEIWNEPDLDVSDDEKKLPTNPRCWGGTVTNFFNLYEISAKHLKAKFPNIKIGGPAVCGCWGFHERFIAYCRDHQAPLDFFSWHGYARDPSSYAERCRNARATLDKYGFTKTESILNEWNYVKGWCDDWVYSLEVERGRYNQKGAAFTMATMITCQYVPLDHLMYYDARPCGMNGLFEMCTALPMKGYYPFYVWNRVLEDYGTQISCKTVESRGKKQRTTMNALDAEGKLASAGEGIYAMAAKGKGGHALLLARYSDDNNVSDTATVVIDIPGVKISKARCLLTDLVRSNTEVPLVRNADGTCSVFMQPNSFALVEW